MRRILWVALWGAGAVLLGVSLSACEEGQPIDVRVEPEGDGFRLLRGGEDYAVRGVGGAHRLELLAEIGGNSFRTWGASQLDETRVGPDGVERPLLDHAHHLGLTVAVGFWMEHERHGFDYGDEPAVHRQLDELGAFVRRFKDHPAVLLWGIGNEVEIGAENPERVFNAIEEAARLVKSIDPNHPTMAVIAEIGDGKGAMVQRLCPSIDVLGVNSYGGLPSLNDRLEAQGVRKPFLVTEYGVLGHWETGATAWGAPYEQTSTQKAAFLREGYDGSIGAAAACLGGYAFLWGHKQERTATWYGMFLSEGEKTGSVDTLAELWTGRVAGDRAPSIGPLDVRVAPADDRSGAGGCVVGPGARIRASVEASDPDGDDLRYVWILREESRDRRMGGDAEAPPAEVAIETHEAAGPGAIEFVAPRASGAYRLFAYVFDGHGGAATANAPFRVE